MKPTKQKEYGIEISGLGMDLTNHSRSGRFLGGDVLSSEGDTLEELIENAVILTEDQDGGEGPIFGIHDYLGGETLAWLERRIRDEFSKLLDLEGRDS